MNRLTDSNTHQDLTTDDHVDDYTSDGLAHLLWKSKWTILVCTILALVAGFTYLLYCTPVYSSVSRLYVEQEGPKVLGDVQSVMMQSKNYLYTQAELLKSTPVLSLALEQMKHQTFQTFSDTDSQINYLKHTLDVQIGKKDDILSVELQSPYPAETACIVNNIVDAYITYHATQKKTTAVEILKILQSQKDRAVEQLNANRRLMLDFQREHPSLTFETDRGNIVLGRLAALADALTSAELQTVEAASFYETVKQLAADPEQLREYVKSKYADRYSLDTAVRSQLSAEKQQLLSTLIETQKQLTPDHPAVIGIQTKLDDIQRQNAQLNEEYTRFVLSIAGQDLKAAEENEQQIRTYFEEQRKQALELNENLIQFSIYQTDARKAENLIDILDERIKEVNVVEDTGVLNISVLEVASPSQEPVSPQKARIMALAVAMGLTLGGLISLIRDKLDMRLQSLDDVKSSLRVPVIGMLPRIKGRYTDDARGRITLLQPLSSTAEAYRTIRTSIFFRDFGTPSKTLLVTSGSTGEGKTTLVSNLALAMAQAGQKTLIIDADIRRASQHRVFTLPNTHGLTSVLAGHMSVQQCVKAATLENLFILTAGPVVLHASEMLNGKSFKILLNTLCEQYDRILIDSPPVLPVTDARILSALSDRTLLVVRAGKTTRNESRTAFTELLNVGARVSGIVVNDLSRGHFGEYYYNDRSTCDQTVAVAPGIQHD